MAEIACGGSVQVCMMRIVALELDGVPIGPYYVTDAITKWEATPVFTKGVDMEIVNGCGAPALIYKDMDRFKRYDVSLELIYTDPELESMLEGTELYTTGGVDVGSGSPAVAAYAGYYPGFSVELWSKRIVNGDLDSQYPYWRWCYPRVRLQMDKTTLENNPSPRMYTGYTSQNPNWEDGPFDDWPFASDTQGFRAATKTLPTPSCGTQTYIHT